MNTMSVLCDIRFLRLRDNCFVGLPLYVHVVRLIVWRTVGLRVVDAHVLKPFCLFDEVEGKIVFSSENVMFLFVEVPPRGVVPMHSHRHEQMGVCLKGKAEVRSETEKATVMEGMFYWFKPNEKHSVTSLIDEPRLFIDVFNPPREDYLEKAKDALKKA
jgi:quercetin dioxygenase-like cupin family protein